MKTFIQLVLLVAGILLIFVFPPAGISSFVILGILRAAFNETR